MRKILFICFSLINSVAFAATWEDNILWISEEKIKTWNITFDDIPKIIQHATTFLLWFAATIAMIMIIVGAFKYTIWSVEWSAPNKQKANDTIKYGVIWFVVAVSAWFIINVLVNNI